MAKDGKFALDAGAAANSKESLKA
ncbi:hypothetical protein [Borreliella valaisiana]|nr:hypothetical protein [Borreliella valaisiana]